VDYAKLEDNVGTAPRPIVPETAAMLGTWVNTNPASGGIVRLRLSARDGGGLTIHPVAAGDDARPEDWGDIPADALYADRIDSRTIIGFTARREAGGTLSHLHANLSLGLLIVAVFVQVTGHGERANFFAREFYRRADAS
jgi:hypothetical protein